MAKTAGESDEALPLIKWMWRVYTLKKMPNARRKTGRVMRVCLGVLLVALVAQPAAVAQQPSTTSPTFEVASVKRNVSGRVGGRFACRLPGR
ncbi:MAG: hypothetical protein ACRD3G_26305 [Vicinamibacterales bacterium]